MEKIVNSIGALCISVFIMGMLYQLGAFEKTAKTIKFVIAIYIVLTVINSFENLNFNLQNTDFTTQYYQQDINRDFQNEIIKETARELENVIKNRLEEKNIAYNSVEVHILEQNGNLTADKIFIECENIYAQDIERCISDIADETTKIIIGD